MKSVEQSNGWPNCTFTGLCVHDNKLIACIQYLQRVDMFSLDLELISKVDVNFAPIQMSLIGNVACVSEELGSIVTSFYKMPDFEPISTHNIAGPVLAHNNFFYVYQNEDFSLFDSHGNFIERKKTNYVKRNDAAGMVIANNQILICLKRSILKLKLGPV
jgi:hypothetical protein